MCAHAQRGVHGSDTQLAHGEVHGHTGDIGQEFRGARRSAALRRSLRLCPGRVRPLCLPMRMWQMLPPPMPC